MKITIMDLLPGEVEEVLIKCDSLTPKVMELINELKHQNEEEQARTVQSAQKLKVYLNGTIHLLAPDEVYYFEYVDQKVFAYGKTKVYEIKVSCMNWKNSSRKQILSGSVSQAF